jgi:hypothetical protein
VGEPRRGTHEGLAAERLISQRAGRDTANTQTPSRGKEPVTRWLIESHLFLSTSVRQRSAVTVANASVAAGLRERYGLETGPVKVREPYQLLGVIEDDLSAAMGVHTAGVFGRSTMLGFLLEGVEGVADSLATGSPGSARVSDNDR